MEAVMRVLILTVTGVAVYCPYLVKTATNPAQGNSPFALDPFMGTYDMLMSTCTASFFEFAESIIGVPHDVVAGGERIVFNKSIDNQSYNQYMMRNVSTYGMTSHFVLGQQGSTDAGNGHLEYFYSMPNASCIIGWYSFPFANFSITYNFLLDGSGFQDQINVTFPRYQTSRCFFNRTDKPY
ncbi:uncharacterized protein LOC129600114 [Paramacrobiotus metropolitanus]|uniref:uncharacterized protein LOC129600114 n=1 Tax=Paramacrobiotus metropolitanus TaxID=2943436 RepID=UPI002445A1DA|nr:uncharacterized protein LOC129600114 [Paramacrobiotus metropolitanus]